MRSRFFLAVTCIILALAPRTEAVDKDKLRQATKLPRVTAQLGFFKFNSSVGLMATDAQAPPPRTPEDVLKALQVTPANADLHAELAESYEVAEKKDLAKQARRKAAELYTQNIQLQPNNVLLYVKLAKVLEEEKANEAEKLLRWAVQAAPGEPQCWLGLADHLRWRTGVVLFGPATEKISLPQMAAILVDKNPGPQALNQALALLDEQQVCLDRAVAAAPNRADLYVRRFGERAFWDCAVRSPVECLLGKTKEPRHFMQGLCAPENLSDLRKAAQLDPNNHLVQGALGTLELVAGLQNNPPNPLQSPWTALPRATQETVTDCANRLEKFAQSKDAAVATSSADLLAAIHALKGDFKAAIPCLTQVVQQRPDDDESWNKLLGFMAVTDSPGLVAQSRKWVDHKDTAHTRYVLAKAYLQAHDHAKTEAEVRAALKHDPADFRANVGLAALLLRRSDKGNTLPEARLYLEKAHAQLKDLVPDQRIEFMLTYAIYLGLAGESEPARQVVNTILHHRPDHEEARALLPSLSN